jgi:hypothetical protein
MSAVYQRRVRVEREIRESAEEVHPFLDRQRTKPPGLGLGRLFGSLVRNLSRVGSHDPVSIPA